LNEEVYNNIAGASLSSFQIILPAGTYYMEGILNNFRNDSGLIDFYNVTDAEQIAQGSRHTSANNSSIGWVSCIASTRAVFTLAAQKTVEMRYRSGDPSGATLGRNVASGEDNRYGTVYIERIA
jgi:hypothetical protein